jgi:hypothetical protein
MLVMRVARSEIDGPVWAALHRVLGISVVGLMLCMVVLVWLAGWRSAAPVGAGRGRGEPRRGRRSDRERRSARR